MEMCEGELNVSDKELRALLIVKSCFSNFKCYSECKGCRFKSDESCMIDSIADDFEDIFLGVRL